MSDSDVFLQEQYLPFELAKDNDGVSFFERMAARLRCRREFQTYVCIADWNDEDGYYASTTTMSWGTTSTKYLGVHKDRTYVRLGMSEEPSWWYVVEPDRAQHVFRYGGWVPPDYFSKIGSIMLIPDILPVFKSHEQENSSVSISFYRSPQQGIVYAYCDGSTKSGLGIAAGWLFAGCFIYGSASLCCMCTGSAAGELLGLVGALYQALTSSLHEEYQFHLDSANAIGYVFKGHDPCSKVLILYIQCSSNL